MRHPAPRTIRGVSQIAIAGLVCACTSPDISSSLSASRTLLDTTIADLDAPISARAARELAAAEAEAARNGTVIVSLPPTCIGALPIPEQDVSACEVIPLVLPLDGAVNATQLANALASLDTYFTALNELATNQSPAVIQTRTAGLLSAIGALDDDINSQSLAQLSTRADAIGPAVAATAGFVADQVRINALRRVTRRADPVIEEIIDLASANLRATIDPINEARDAVLDAQLAYREAHARGDASGQLAGAATLRRSVTALHRAEAASPARRLHVLRDLHGAMTRQIAAGGDLEDIDRLITKTTEIIALWEAANGN